MKNRNDGRLGMVGVYALMLCICVGLSATFLQSFDLNDDVYRFVRELFTEHTTGLCSTLLYVTLGTLIGVRVRAARKRHHDIKWFSTGNIIIAVALYCFTAVCLNGNDMPIALDAALNPLFWLTDNAMTVLKCIASLIGFATLIYGAWRYCIRRPMRFLINKRRVFKNQIKPFKQELSTLEDPLEHYLLHQTFLAMRDERHGTDNT